MAHPSSPPQTYAQRSLHRRSRRRSSSSSGSDNIYDPAPRSIWSPVLHALQSSTLTQHSLFFAIAPFVLFTLTLFSVLLAIRAHQAAPPRLLSGLSGSVFLRVDEQTTANGVLGRVLLFTEQINDLLGGGVRAWMQACVLSLIVLRGLVWISAYVVDAVLNFEYGGGGVWCWEAIAVPTERDTGSLNVRHRRRIKGRQ